jgi:UDP-glucuronate decarboxylase
MDQSYFQFTHHAIETYDTILHMYKAQSPKELVDQDIQNIIDGVGNWGNRLHGKNVLISGGAGFLGSYFSEAAIKLGARVTCIDNFITSTRDNVTNLINHPNFSLIQEDITKVEIPPKMDYLVHMAAIPSPSQYQKYPLESLNSCILGSIKLLDYAKHNQVLAYLLTSTSEVYGDPPESEIPTNEDYAGLVHSFGPRSMYDEAKRAEEAYAYAYWKTYKVPVRIARIFNTYGPKIDITQGTGYGRAMTKFILQALKNEPLTIYGNGQMTRSFCYVTDQVTGLMRLMLQDNMNGEIMNLGNTQEITIEDLVKMIKEMSKTKSEIKYQAKPGYDLKDDPQRRVPEIAKARKLIDFEPKVSLTEGINRTLSWNQLNSNHHEA